MAEATRMTGVPVSKGALAATAGPSGRRPLFRGYHKAFSVLIGLHVLEVAAASFVGAKVFNKSFLEIFAVGDVTALLPGWFLLPLTWIGILAVQITRRQSDRPSLTMARVIRFRFDWLVRGLLILGGYLLLTKSFTVLKSAIPEFNSYYFDPLLVKFDIWLLGNDAWKITHAIMPNWFLVGIDRLYFLWFTYVVVMTGVIAFNRDPRFQVRSAIAFHLCWFVIGIMLATKLASVGPVFYDAYYGSTHFSELGEVLREADRRESLGAVFAMNFLLENRGTTKLGVGISAMPSVHVALAFLGFLMAMHHQGKLWLKALTAAFTAAILLGSVHLGWHYLSDGLVSLIATWIIWLFADRLVSLTHGADRSRSPAPTAADRAATPSR